MATHAPIAPAIHPGAVITHGANRYTIGLPFGAGGFGTVFHAKRTAPTPAELVVKVPAAHIASDPVYSAKFEREATILANISHINVVHIIDFWRFPSGEMALVQELVSGAQKLTDYIPLHRDEAPSIFLQALYAMRAFHNPPGAIHRDISPANILVDASGMVKIIDFGLAKEDPRVGQILTVTGQWFGTPGCMAPEQLDDAKRVDHRADLYGLGRSITAVLQSRKPMHAEPALLVEPWRIICMKLCAHDADDRYNSATETIEDALERFSEANIALTRFPLHLAETAMSGTPKNWPKACRTYFGQFSDIDPAQLELASRLKPDAFSGSFEANEFFDRLEASSAIQAFDSYVASFDDCDPLGLLYRRLYTSLDNTRRIHCFRRLCRTAIKWHRYAVMGNVRDTYALEHDPGVQAQLIAVLNQEDPQRVVHGRGIIPGRDP